MAHYILAIDETGNFLLGKPAANYQTKTFVCGVCLKDVNKQTIEEKFGELRQRISDFKNMYPEEYQKERKKEFHYKEMTNRERAFCRGFFSPLVTKIIKSEGSPAIYANNQNWWLSALIAVVDGFFRNTSFNSDDTVEIIIEFRDENYLGIPKNFNLSYDAKFWKELQSFLRDCKIKRREVNKLLTLRWIETLNITTLKQQLYDFIQEQEEKVTSEKIKDWMDSRYEVVKETTNGGKGKKMPRKLDSFMSYHEIVKQQIIDHVSIYCSNYGMVNPTVSFRNDLYTSLADIECGLVLNDKEDKEKIESYSCVDNYAIEDPVRLLETAPLQSLIFLLREFEEERYDNYKLVNKIFPKLLENAEADKSAYLYAWDCFYDFLKNQINYRQIKGTLVKLKNCVDAFSQEFRNFISTDLKSIRESDIDLLILFTEYYSHIGSIEIPFSEEESSKVLWKDRRILHRWENLYRYNLRKSQLHFNSYNFDEDIEIFTNMYNVQKSLINALPPLEKPSDKPQKPSDSHIVTIINTIAQANAFQGNVERAIELFKSSLAYGDSAQTHSYIQTCYHKQKNLCESIKEFEEQIKRREKNPTAKDYYNGKDYSNVWELLSYVKLRALDLYLNKTSELKGIDIESVEKYAGNEYPFPLIKKWEAVALYLEDQDTNKEKVKRLLSSAIDDLLSVGNEFAITTLAITVFHCLALVDCSTELCDRYVEYINTLRGQSQYFDDFLDRNKDLLDLNNNLDLWDRALLLPFNYS